MSRQMMLTVAFSAAAAALATLAVLSLAPQTPTAAVVAFAAADSCPQGWEDYTEANGRVIIGAGQGAGLTLRDFGSTGGQEIVAWKDIGLIPSPTLSSTSGGFILKGIFAPIVAYRKEAEPEIFDIPTMSPYLVLRYCRKR